MPRRSRQDPGNPSPALTLPHVLPIISHKPPLDRLLTGRSSRAEVLGDFRCAGSFQAPHEFPEVPVALEWKETGHEARHPVDMCARLRPPLDASCSDPGKRSPYGSNRAGAGADPAGPPGCAEPRPTAPGRDQWPRGRRHAQSRRPRRERYPLAGHDHDGDGWEAPEPEGLGGMDPTARAPVHPSAALKERTRLTM